MDTIKPVLRDHCHERKFRNVSVRGADLTVAEPVS